MRPLAAAAAFAALAVLGLAAPAHAQWSLCNETSYIVEAAIAYDEAGRRVTEGWTRVRPGECRTVREGPLTPGVHYLYARSSLAHRGGRREWSGYESHCVDIGDFSIAGEATCEEVGFETRGFVEIDVSGEERRTALMQPEDYGAETAEVAGVQRLLQDNGYDVRLDGDRGRRTERAIQRFLDDQGIAGSPDTAALMDRLEEAALAHAEEVGLRLCNRAEGDVWTAIAVRREESWESRGWWPLAPDECAKVIDAELDAPAYYVYAGLRENGVDRPLAAADERFCIAETRFAIIGRENCPERGFSEGRFTTILSQGRTSVTLEFADGDFSPEPDEDGARR